MKILYVYDNYPSTYQKYLVNLLHAIKKKCFIKTLVYTASKEANYTVKRYGFMDILQNVKYKLGFSKYKSIDLNYFFDFDIIHLQHSYLWRKLEPLKQFKKFPKIVVTLRGGDTYVKPWLSKSWQNFYKNSEHIAAFVVMSNHQKRYLHEKWGVSLSKIHVIPISFGEKSMAQPKYPNSEKLKLVSAFRMTWEKNIEGTIQLAKKLQEQNIDFKFDIYGDGNDLGQLYYLIDRYNLQKNVFVKGKVENDLLKAKLAEYDFFVQLSISESLGMSVIEAQSVGLPCVVSNSDGLPEAVLNEKTGIVLNYNDYNRHVCEIIKLKTNKEVYYDFSKNAIQFANENYSVENEVEKLTSLYKNIL